MSYIDVKYILEISPLLSQFKKKKDTLYNCRCPYCGDSQKKKFKARGFIYEKSGEYFFRCHNCGYGTNIAGFIKHLDPIKYRHYLLEKFGNVREELPLLKQEIKHITPKFKTSINLMSVSELEKDHWVRKYVVDRKIPEVFFGELYYAPSFKDFVDDLMPNHGKDLIENDVRLIIPFYDENKNLIAFQGRALNSNKIRYITIKIHEDNPKVFGLDRVKKDQVINVLEGPIDSLMVSNAIAVCDSSLRGASKYLPKESLVLIFDNQYHNREIQQQIDRSIADGFNVCLFPKSTNGKDLNDMVKNGMSYAKLETYIKDHTYFGLRAILEFNLLKG